MAELSHRIRSKAGGPAKFGNEKLAMGRQANVFWMIWKQSAKASSRGRTCMREAFPSQNGVLQVGHSPPRSGPACRWWGQAQSRRSVALIILLGNGTLLERRNASALASEANSRRRTGVPTLWLVMQGNVARVINAGRDLRNKRRRPDPASLIPLL